MVSWLVCWTFAEALFGQRRNTMTQNQNVNNLLQNFARKFNMFGPYWYFWFSVLLYSDRGAVCERTGCFVFCLFFVCVSFQTTFRQRSAHLYVGVCLQFPKSTLWSFPRISNQFNVSDIGSREMSSLKNRSCQSPQFDFVLHVELRNLWNTFKLTPKDILLAAAFMCMYIYVLIISIQIALFAKMMRRLQWLYVKRMHLIRVYLLKRTICCSSKPSSLCNVGISDNIQQQKTQQNMMHRIFVALWGVYKQHHIHNIYK